MSKENDFRERLDALAEKMTEKSRREARERAMDYCRQFDAFNDLSSKGPFAKRVGELIRALDVSESGSFTWSFCRKASPAKLRQTLVDYLKLPCLIEYTDWSVVREPDPSRPDRDNLRACTRHELTEYSTELFNLDRALSDVLHMLGQLAYNIKSVSLRRVIRFLVRFDRDFFDGRGCVQAKEPERLVDEFIACWQLVLKEASFVDAVEKPKIWPKRPVASTRPYFEFDKFSLLEGLTRSEANEWICDEAHEKYDQRMNELAERCGGKWTFDHLADAVRDLDKAIEGASLSHGLSLPEVDWEVLSILLAADTLLTYDCCDPDEGDDIVDSTTQFDMTSDEATHENRLKKEVVRTMARCLKSACKLAKKVESKAYDSLVRCRQIGERWDDCFFSVREIEDQQAKGDLKLYVTGLKEALPILAADVENFVPKEDALTKSDGERLKEHISQVAELEREHVTSETNREIAAKAPKRKRRYGHEGNGRKGTQTTTQVEQLRRFEKFLLTHPATGKRGESRNSRALQFWRLNPDLEKAVTATGEAHGYKNYKCLAKAKCMSA